MFGKYLYRDRTAYSLLIHLKYFVRSENDVVLHHSPRTLEKNHTDQSERVYEYGILAQCMCHRGPRFCGAGDSDQ